MTNLTRDAFEAAAARGRRRLAGPRAESAHYDAERGRVVVRLDTGVEICFSPQAAQGLLNASTEDLAIIEVEAFGLGIHFPRLDADLYVPSLVRGLAGSKRWMAARVRPAGSQTARESRRRGLRAPKAALGE